MSNAFALDDLPVELQGKILQEAAYRSSGPARTQLMLVSKMAHDWVSYIQYDTIIIKSLESFQSCLSIVGARDPAFLSTRIRALLIKIYSEGALPLWIECWRNFIPKLSRLQYLEVWDPFSKCPLEDRKPVRDAVIPALQALPRLSYLGIHPSFLWDPSPSSQVKFQSITHLKLFSLAGKAPSLLSTLESFPSLTHLMAPLEGFDETAMSLVENLTRLEVFILGRNWSSQLVDKYPHVVTPKSGDVFMDSDIPTFERLADGHENNVWRQATIEVALKGLNLDG
ncbi:hypothetical protein DL96DRAFT_1629484 [Flagelloscypha sp. PMI_526]|nr:hypothetical protein DL96DRAFT_1629484 [Flagelloscypha sp. PMI_526]